MSGLLIPSALVLAGLTVVSGVLLIGSYLPVVALPLTALTHLVAGLLGLAPVALLLWRHRRLRGPSTAGLWAALVLGAAFATGLAQAGLALFTSAPPRWLLTAHLGSSAVALALSGVHLAGLGRTASRVRRVSRSTLIVVGCLLTSAAVAAGVSLVRAPAAAAPDYAQPYGDNPFAPSRLTVSPEGFLHPATLSGSAACGVCHADIYAQWSESMHRYSATDPHVATGIRWFQRDNGPEAGRFCAGCHNPIALLAGEVDPRLAGGEVGTRPYDEGISCLGCHATTHVDEARLGNASLVISPPRLPPQGPAYNALIRADPAAHAQAMLAPDQRTAAFCGACHQQATPESLTGVPEEPPHGQYAEWLASPYAPGGATPKTCGECHMPRVPSNDPAADDGMVRSHRFLGANHAHAVASGHEAQAEATLAFLRDAITLDAGMAARQDRPGFALLEVRTTNKGGGHRFPSGTTDISEAWLEVVAGPAEAPLFTSGLLDPKAYLDPDAHVWKTVYVDADNVPVDLHNLAAVRRTTVDRAILPGATDTAVFAIPLRDVGNLTAVPVRVRLRLRKANQRWTDWLTNFDGTTVPVTDIHERVLSFDPQPLPKDAPPPAPLPSALARDEAAPPIAGMVYVPGGPAIIGSDEGDADERPVRTVDVAGFYIDRLPITNADYARYLVAKRLPGPAHHLPWAERYNWRGQQYPKGSDRRPAVLIRWSEARDYCAWAGKRLPRESEWEKAARGPDGRRYPWGERWEDGACAVIRGKEVPDTVGACPNRDSQYGVKDLVGGVFEWVQEPYRAYDRTELHPNANEWIAQFNDQINVIRGAPGGQEGPATTAASRSGQADNMRARIGFRCAKDGP